MIGQWFDRVSHALGVCVAESWRDLPRASTSRDPLDIDALNTTLDRLEARLVRRRLQILDAASATPEVPDGHDHDA